ncbi:MAG: 30S ribosomal protein S4e [Candidatus Woesearchaeota archaeon]
MKNHLKRLASPKNWMIDRKMNKFIVKPSPGPHPQEASLPLGVILRDFLKYTQTMREAKKLLNTNEVLVDGKRKRNPRLPVGMFDVLSIPTLKEHFRLLLDSKGRIAIKKIEEKESSVKPCKITGKKIVSGKMQLNLHDGKNILVEKDFKGKVGDTVLLSLPELKIKESFELKKGAFVFLTKGKRGGDSGVLQELKERQAVYQKDQQEIETLKKYLFVLGNKESSITI